MAHESPAPENYARAMQDDAPPPCERRNGDTLILFDVDGTLTVPAQRADEAMVSLLARLRKRYAVGIVGAGDYEKQTMQLHGDLHARLDFVFSENGVHAWRAGKCLHCKSIVEHLGQARWAAFEAGIERELHSHREETARLLCEASPGTTLDGRGTFLERRQCTVNVCAIGRTPPLSREARAAFAQADSRAGLRRRIVSELESQFGAKTEYDLSFSIGGQIGIDVCPCVAPPPARAAHAARRCVSRRVRPSAPTPVLRRIITTAPFFSSQARMGQDLLPAVRRRRRVLHAPLLRRLDGRGRRRSRDLRAPARARPCGAICR